MNINENFEYWFRAVVVRVIDGDTVVMQFDLGRRIYSEDSIRLYGIDAPELSQIGGIESKEYLENLLPSGMSVVVQTFKNKNEKYGRWLGEIYLETGNNVNQLLVEAGHARLS